MAIAFFKFEPLLYDVRKKFHRILKTPITTIPMYRNAIKTKRMPGISKKNRPVRRPTSIAKKIIELILNLVIKAYYYTFSGSSLRKIFISQLAQSVPFFFFTVPFTILALKTECITSSDVSIFSPTPGIS